MNKKGEYDSKWTQEHYDQLTVRVKKGEKQILFDISEERGISISDLITESINAKIGENIIRKVGE